VSKLIQAFLLGACILPVGAQSYDDQLTRARTAINEKRYHDAQVNAEEAIRLDQNRWEAYVLAASAYSSQQLLDDAIGMLDRALSRAPEERKALIREALADARKQLSSPKAAAGAPTDAEPRAGASK
jgi:Tfp pilus assembly protein PilF